MSECTFIKTPEEVEHFKTNVNWMNDCEGVYAAWATDGAALANVLPSPLKPAVPVIISYVIEAPNNNFSVPYKEIALMTPVMKGDKPGLYTIAMMLQGSDNAVAMGRDVLSIPKKNADSITVKRDGDTISACGTRMGIDVIRIDAKIGDFNDPMGAQLFGTRAAGEVADSLSYFYKFEVDQNAQGESVINDISILSAHMQTKYQSWENASVNVKLTASESDPWAELPVLKPLGGGWSKFDLGLLGVLGSEPVSDNLDNVIARLIAPRFDAQAYR